jgi:hypothetical protein
MLLSPCILANRLPLDISFKFIKAALVITALVIKLIVPSRFFAYLCFQFIVSIIILLAWMLYLFNLYLLMPVVVIVVSLTMKLTKNREYSFDMYHKDSNNFFSPIRVKYI